ncbi:PREDICTED: uncharacterized protein LOC102021966 [Chinchilla lanigera]|uniref:uncharacterized protein LOC102021966 n=1 Tax=Chinchilla lanigera TaxID=34839 RepID=UPI00038EF2DE|nr:PREDICTED: uncharacterized protein LOC102021966 [Chinchilla lanigera]
MPEYPYPLIGWDLLYNLQAQISFGEDSTQITFAAKPEFDPRPPTILFMCPLMEEHLLLTEEEPQPSSNALLSAWKTEIHGVWAEINPSGLTIQPPIVVSLVPGATPIRVCQYPLSSQAQLRINVHIQRLKREGILVPCKLASNTPLLLVQKPGTTDYRPVQVLREDEDDDPELPVHDCMDILNVSSSLRSNLTDVLLQDLDITLYTDGCSYVQDGVRYAGAAVVTEKEVIWAQALGHGTSAQRAELIALTQSL